MDSSIIEKKKNYVMEISAWENWFHICNKLLGLMAVI